MKVVGSNNCKSIAKETRETFCNCFNTPYGADLWYYLAFSLKKARRTRLATKLTYGFFNREETVVKRYVISTI